VRAAEASMPPATTLESFLASPHVICWRDAFKQFGMNPGEFRPAHEALGRRVLQGKPLPDINPAVNIGNVISIRHRLPVGVHPVDDVKSGLELRLASGDETFVAFGSEKNERPRPGEVVFADGHTVVSRAWVWRQAKSSVTLPTTRSLVVNIDRLPPVSQNEIQMACDEVETMIRNVCGGEVTRYVLSATNPAVTIEVV
jgi:DNA/RNA-binding domain of Phe-tRNA-synthetase-like protein